MPDLLRAEGIVFGYHGTPVLREVSMAVPADGFVGILGPNGSGKTTLLRALAGTSGRRADVSCSMAAISLRIPRQTLARRMAVVAQETHLAFDYTALEVVMMGRYPHLSTFEIEGPGDFTIAREAHGRHRNAGAAGSPLRHAQRRRKTARDCRGSPRADCRRGRVTAFSCSMSRRSRSISRISSNSASCCANASAWATRRSPCRRTI